MGMNRKTRWQGMLWLHIIFLCVIMMFSTGSDGCSCDDPEQENLYCQEWPEDFSCLNIPESGGFNERGALLMTADINPDEGGYRSLLMCDDMSNFEIWNTTSNSQVMGRAELSFNTFDAENRTYQCGIPLQGQAGALGLEEVGRRHYWDGHMNAHIDGWSCQDLTYKCFDKDIGYMETQVEAQCQYRGTFVLFDQNQEATLVSRQTCGRDGCELRDCGGYQFEGFFPHPKNPALWGIRYSVPLLECVGRVIKSAGVSYNLGAIGEDNRLILYGIKPAELQRRLSACFERQLSVTLSNLQGVNQENQPGSVFFIRETVIGDEDMDAETPLHRFLSEDPKTLDPYPALTRCFQNVVREQFELELEAGYVRGVSQRAEQFKGTRESPMPEGFVRMLEDLSNVDIDGDFSCDILDKCPLIPHADEDEDDDNIGDACDNCPRHRSRPSNQYDRDGDLIGDVCDICDEVGEHDLCNCAENNCGSSADGADMDHDKVNDDADNCPEVFNPLPSGRFIQTDQDADRLGDECDNCVSIANPDQADQITPNGIGDACDDTDDDHIYDLGDNCPYVANQDQSNIDNDEEGDVCDDDMDGDGMPNEYDNCVQDPNSDQVDLDQDGEGDACDEDDDGDGVNDGSDNCPQDSNSDQTNQDEDHLGDACDDSDSDGYVDAVDNCVDDNNPGQDDRDGDEKGDVCDLCPDLDSRIDPNYEEDHDEDQDGVRDCNDNCPRMPNPPINGVQVDSNNNGLGDACDLGEFGFLDEENTIYINRQDLPGIINLPYILVGPVNAVLQWQVLQGNVVIRPVEVLPLMTPIRWDGTNTLGQVVPPGVYTVSLGVEIPGHAQQVSTKQVVVYDLKFSGAPHCGNNEDEGADLVHLYVNNDDDNGNDVPDMMEPWREDRLRNMLPEVLWPRVLERRADQQFDNDLARFVICMRPHMTGELRLTSADVESNPGLHPELKIWGTALRERDSEIELPKVYQIPHQEERDVYVEGLAGGLVRINLEFVTEDNQRLEGEGKSFNLVQVDVVKDGEGVVCLNQGDCQRGLINESDPRVDFLDIASWQNAYDAQGRIYNESDPWRHFIDRDPDKYFVRVINQGANVSALHRDRIDVNDPHSVQVSVSDRGGTPLRLDETGEDTGVFVSQSQVLLSQQNYYYGLFNDQLGGEDLANCATSYRCNDDHFPINDGYGNLVQQGQAGYRVHQVTLDDDIKVHYEAQRGLSEPEIKVPVCQRYPDKRKELPLKFYIFKEPFQDHGVWIRRDYYEQHRAELAERGLEYNRNYHCAAFDQESGDCFDEEIVCRGLNEAYQRSQGSRIPGNPNVDYCADYIPLGFKDGRFTYFDQNNNKRENHNKCECIDQNNNRLCEPFEAECEPFYELNIGRQSEVTGAWQYQEWELPQVPFGRMYKEGFRDPLMFRWQVSRMLQMTNAVWNQGCVSVMATGGVYNVENPRNSDSVDIFAERLRTNVFPDVARIIWEHLFDRDADVIKIFIVPGPFYVAGEMIPINGVAINIPVLRDITGHQSIFISHTTARYNTLAHELGHILTRIAHNDFDEELIDPRHPDWGRFPTMEPVLFPGPGGMGEADRLNKARRLTKYTITEAHRLLEEGEVSFLRPYHADNRISSEFESILFYVLGINGGLEEYEERRQEIENDWYEPDV